MVPRWLSRLAVLAVVVVVGVVPGVAAQADDGTVSLDGTLPATARPGGRCADVTRGIDLDVWVFRVATEAEFVSLTLRFVPRGGAPVIRTVDSSTSSGGGLDGSQAWIATDAGWSLVGGTAVVTGKAGTEAETGTADGFELGEACAAQSMVGLAPMIHAPEQPPSVQGGRSPRALAAGMDIGATVTFGATLVLAGALLLIVRRRPRGRHRAPRAS